MKLKHPLIALIATSSIFTASSIADEIPTGSLTVGSGLDAVKEGSIPNVAWTINHPQAPIDTETLTTTTKTHMSVQVLGTSIVVRRKKRFTNTEMKFSNESSWVKVFQGYDTDVDVSKVVLSRDLPANTRIEFRTQRESATGGVDPWRFFEPTDVNNHHVNVFRDGDPLPWVGLPNSQRSISDFLSAYLNQEETHVLLDDNQIIIAVEMGTSTPGDRGFDMQDAIFLLTFTNSEETTVTP